MLKHFFSQNFSRNLSKYYQKRWSYDKFDFNYMYFGYFIVNYKIIINLSFTTKYNTFKIEHFILF